jgi:hypothetical protein
MAGKVNSDIYSLFKWQESEVFSPVEHDQMSSFALKGKRREKYIEKSEHIRTYQRLSLY